MVADDRERLGVAFFIFVPSQVQKRTVKIGKEATADKLGQA